MECAEAAARGKDKGWKPATVEVAVIQVGDGRTPGALKNFGLDAQGNVLACYVPNGPRRPGMRRRAGHPGLFARWQTREDAAAGDQPGCRLRDQGRDDLRRGRWETAEARRGREGAGLRAVARGRRAGRDHQGNGERARGASPGHEAARSTR